MLKFSLLFFFVFQLPAYAYLDPGSFSLVAQAILGAIAGVGATYRLWWSKLKNIFKKKKLKKKIIMINDFKLSIIS